MRRWFNLRTFTLLLIAMLVLALAVPAVMAQEGEHDDTAAVEGEQAAEEGHEEESSGGISALGINTGFLLAQIINFGLIAGLLTVVLWRPVVNMMDARAKKIEKGIEDAAAAANARMNAEAEAEKILTQARTEAAQVLEEARSRGEEVAKSIEADARKEAEKIRADARISAQSERDVELAGLRGHVAAISVAVAKQLIGTAMTQKRQETLINNFFTKVPAEAKKLKGDVQVVSAMPLTDAEQKKIQKEIGADSVDFVVDPAILGGLIIRAGDQVVDGSINSNLSALASSLQ